MFRHHDDRIDAERMIASGLAKCASQNDDAVDQQCIAATNGEIDCEEERPACQLRSQIASHGNPVINGLQRRLG
jgi:hypothetical protein